jgi:hypothetical protein
LPKSITAIIILLLFNIYQTDNQSSNTDVAIEYLTQIGFRNERSLHALRGIPPLSYSPGYIEEFNLDERQRISEEGGYYHRPND